MSIIKGIFNFILVLILSVLLSVWIGYQIVEETALSYDNNEALLKETDFSEEVSQELFIRYKTKLNSIQADEALVKQLVDESALGIIAFVNGDNDSMPDIDVTFLKKYVEEQVIKDEAGKLYGNTDIGALVQYLKAIPEGESISKAFESFLEASSVSLHEEEVTLFLETYLENRDLEAEALEMLIIEKFAYEKLNLDQMSTTLSLDEFFNNVTDKNVVQLARDILLSIDRTIDGYMLLFMILIFLVIFVLELRISSTCTWLIISSVIAIIPLQGLRLIRLAISEEYLSVFKGLESYAEFMSKAVIERLNFYTIIVVIIIVILFIVGKLSKKFVDNSIKAVQEKKSKIVILAKTVIILVLFVALFFNGKGLYRHNMMLTEELMTLNPDEFIPNDFDDTLGKLLNIEFDF